MNNNTKIAVRNTAIQRSVSFLPIKQPIIRPIPEFPDVHSTPAAHPIGNKTRLTFATFVPDPDYG